jgi:hypothetical protein
MVDYVTLQQAQGLAHYSVTPLHTEDGAVAPHFLRFAEDMGYSWDNLMLDPRFAEIIGKEVATESMANGPLHALAELAPSERARDTFLHWLAFINADLNPWTTGGSIHFRPHWGRVLMLSQALGELEGLSDTDLEALAAAASFHDSRRADPYLDTGHGARAAKYYKRFCEDTQRGYARATLAGRSIAYDDRVYFAVAWHDREDAEGEEAIRAFFSGRPVSGVDAVRFYRILKDVDGLDRVRLGGNDFDPSYLRCSHAPELIDYAQRLYMHLEA